jgi:hypothetical protein
MGYSQSLGPLVLGQMHSRIECEDCLSELLQSELELGERCLEIASAFETPEHFKCDIGPHLAELREIVALLIGSLKKFDDPKAKALVIKLRKQVMVGSDL